MESSARESLREAYRIAHGNIIVVHLCNSRSRNIFYCQADSQSRTRFPSEAAQGSIIEFLFVLIKLQMPNKIMPKRAQLNEIQIKMTKAVGTLINTANV